MLPVSFAGLQGLTARPVDVAIIGGGPCGLATALALSKSRCLKGRASHAHRTHTDEWTALALCVRMAARAHGTACAHCMATASSLHAQCSQHAHCILTVHAHCILTVCAHGCVCTWLRVAARAHGTACALHAHCMLTAGRVEVFESDAFGPKGASIQISKYGWEPAVQPIGSPGCSRMCPGCNRTYAGTAGRRSRPSTWTPRVASARPASP